MGTLVSALVDFARPAGQVDNVTDVDSGALLGIAVTAADTANGTWFYSTDNGANWNALGAVASNNVATAGGGCQHAALLPAQRQLHGTLATAITFRAWDQTSGSNGTLADTTSNGGTTAFSTATDTASLVINPVADTPSVTNATTNEDTQTTSGLVISRNVADGVEVTHFKITGITNGTLYQNDGTTPITNGTFITFAEGNAGLKFTPTANFNGSGSFTVQASTSNGDAGLGGSTVVATITVNAVNDAPVLDNTKSPALTAINEDAGAPSGAVGTLVSSLVDFAVPAGQVDNVTDVDSGALLGIAVTAADTTNGVWWYSTDNGANWNALGAVASNNARLLAADANTRLYFQPNANYSGTLATAITFRAWDQTSGSNGTLADTTSNGGTTAFSTATDTASLTVNAVNDAPVLDNTQEPDAHGPERRLGRTVRRRGHAGLEPGGLRCHPSGQVDNVTDVDSGALLGIAVTAADTTNGTWWYSTNNGTSWNALGAVASNNARLLAADANTRLYFQPNANYHGTLASAITFRAWDQTSGSNGTLADTTSNGGTTAFSTATDTASLVINPVADTPSVTNATTNEDTQTTSGLVISRNVADGVEVTHFKITGITNGTLYKNDGTTQITNGTFITFAEGNAGLKFTPTADFNGSGSFTVQASTVQRRRRPGRQYGGRDHYGQRGQRRARCWTTRRARR